MEGSSSSFTHKNGGGSLGDNSFNVDIRCKYGLKATLVVCKRGQNIGKVFLGCPLWKTSSCGYFKWVNDMNKGSSSSIRSGDEDVPIRAAVEESKWEAKCGRVKQKKNMLMSENEALKNQVMKLMVKRDVSVERKRVLLRLLYASWVVVVCALIGIVWKNSL